MVVKGAAAGSDPSRPEPDEGPRLRPPVPPLFSPTATLAAAGGDDGGNPPAAGDTAPNTGSVRAGRPTDPLVEPGAPKKSRTVRLSPLPPPSTRPPPPPPTANDIGGAVGAGAGAGAGVGVSASCAPPPPTAPSRRRANPKREHDRGDVRGDGWMGDPVRLGGDVSPGLGPPPAAATRSAAGRREAPNRVSDGVAVVVAAGWRAATQPGPPGAAAPLGRPASPMSFDCPRLRTLPAPPLVDGAPHSWVAGRVDAAAVGSGPNPGGAKPGGGGGWGRKLPPTAFTAGAGRATAAGTQAQALGGDATSRAPAPNVADLNSVGPVAEEDDEAAAVADDREGDVWASTGGEDQTVVAGGDDQTVGWDVQAVCPPADDHALLGDSVIDGATPLADDSDDALPDNATGVFRADPGVLAAFDAARAAAAAAAGDEASMASAAAPQPPAASRDGGGKRRRPEADAASDSRAGDSETTGRGAGAAAAGSAADEGAVAVADVAVADAATAAADAAGCGGDSRRGRPGSDTGSTDTGTAGASRLVAGRAVGGSGPDD